MLQLLCAVLPCAPKGLDVTLPCCRWHISPNTAHWGWSHLLVTTFWFCQSWSEMPPCAQSCCCRLSLAQILHVRQVRDLLQDKLELRWLTVA